MSTKNIVFKYLEPQFYNIFATQQYIKQYINKNIFTYKFIT